jgi:uncharacterized membrane-anchored protein
LKDFYNDLQLKQMAKRVLEAQAIELIKDDLVSSPAVKSTYNEEVSYTEINAKIETLRQNNSQRVIYARRTFWLTAAWLAVSMAILILKGLSILIISDAVLITLITTTTVSVFGFFILVMQYLFNTKN